MTQRRQHTICLLLLLLIVAAVFVGSLSNGFVWDDHALVEGRKVYSTFDLRGFLFAPGNGLEYLPLRDLTYALDYAIWGERFPTGFHATNLLLYLATAVVLYFLTLRILPLLAPGRPASTTSHSIVSLLITVCYLVHPIQSQAVNLIICRNVLLSGLFLYAAFLMYLKAVPDDESFRAGPYIASLILFLCALLSKATVIILPLLLILIEWLRHRLGAWRTWRLMLPFIGLATVFSALFYRIAVASRIIGQENLGDASSSLSAKSAVAAQIPWFYLKKLLLPINLAAEYDICFAQDWAHFAALFSLAGIVILLAYAVWLRKERPELLFGLGWFLMALLPVLNIFATNPIIADRYAYLPAYGFSLVLVTTLSRQQGALGYIRYFLLIPVIAWCIMSFAGNAEWKTDKTLWEATLRKVPGLIKASTNLGWVYFHEGSYEKAFEVFRGEQTRAPGSINYELAQGYLAFKRKNYAAAIPELRKALFKKDDALYPLYLLAQSYSLSGDEARAVEAFNRILLSREIDNSGYRQTAHNNLKMLLPKFEARLRPLLLAANNATGDKQAIWQLAEQLYRLGFFEKALDSYRKAEGLSSVDGLRYARMANVHYLMGNYEESIRYAGQSLAFGGDPSMAHYQKGMAYLRAGRLEEAEKAFEQSDRLVPDKPEGLLMLAHTRYRRGDTSGALSIFLEAGKKFPAYDFFIGPYLGSLRVASGTGVNKKH